MAETANETLLRNLLQKEHFTAGTNLSPSSPWFELLYRQYAHRQSGFVYWGERMQKLSNKLPIKFREEHLDFLNGLPGFKVAKKLSFYLKAGDYTLADDLPMVVERLEAYRPIVQCTIKTNQEYLWGQDFYEYDCEHKMHLIITYARDL